MFLSRIEDQHLDQLMNWRNDPEIMKWCRQTLPISQSDQEEWFNYQFNDPSVEMFTIFEVRQIRNQECVTLVGVCGLTSINLLHRRAEFSLYIGTEYQGKGYGSKALRKLFEVGFNQLNLNNIWGETFAGNPAIKMFERIGMKYDGTRRNFYFKNGEYIDAHLYSINQDEFTCLKSISTQIPSCS